MPDLVTFESGNSTYATLTGGNTWTGNDTFTVGAYGAGLFLINIHLTGSTSVSSIIMIANNTILQSPHVAQSETTQLVWLNFNDATVRATSGSSVIGVTFNTNGTCYWSIVKLK